MSEHSTVRYIVFEYITGWRSTGGFPLAVFAFITGEPTAHLHTAANWKERVPAENQQLLADIFAEWEGMDDLQTLDLFLHLSEAGAGPLQASTSGTCTKKQLSTILEEQLGIDMLQPPEPGI